MHGIPCKSGFNDCYWNVEGKCTSWIVTQEKPKAGLSRNWDSRQNCTLTQVGVRMCHEYFQEGQYRRYIDES